MPQVAARRHGIVFSNVISAAMSAIHVMLMTPSANSPAISAQQQPRHQAACLDPISSAPRFPSRQAPKRNPNGLRHFPRHASFSGVSS